MSNLILHKRSVVVNDGIPKLPSPDKLAYGELAINFADGYETLTIRNSEDEIAEFKSKEYFENVIVENELVTSAALNDLNERITSFEEDFENVIVENELVTITALNERITSVEENFENVIVENELLTSTALNNLNERITSFEEDFENVIVENELVTITALNERITSVEENFEENLPIFLQKITYDELVTLRNNGELIPGQLYRIIDYVTTTTQLDTLSAGHPFDVIVLALSKNALAEEAYAVHSERDTEGYFANSNLSAWKIWYSLDNDTAKFAWADAENGKGVIYRMIDEFNNDIPYDFKNILFKRYKTTSTHETLVNDKSKIEDYIGYKPTTYHPENLPAGLTIISDDDYKWYYTFNALVDTVDLTLTIIARANIIKPDFPGDNNSAIQTLNNIVFRCTELYNNFFETGCYNMTCLILQDTIFSNTFGQYSRNNIFVCEGGFNQNKIGDNFLSNIFIARILGNNDIGRYSQRNIITNTTFARNTIRMSFQDNTIIGIVQDNTIGNFFINNKIDSYEEDNGGLIQTTIGVFCKNCTFKRIVSCIIGHVCQNNTIERLSQSQIGIQFKYNTFKTSNDLNSSNRPYIRCCTFGDHICYNNFYNSSTASSSNYIQNLRVQSNLQGTSATSPNHIEVPVASVGEIIVSKNSAGEIKIYNMADLIQ